MSNKEPVSNEDMGIYLTKKVIDRDKATILALEGIRDLAREETKASKTYKTVTSLNSVIDALKKYVKGSELILSRVADEKARTKEHDYNRGTN